MARLTKAARERVACFTMRDRGADAKRLGSLVRFTSNEVRRYAETGYRSCEVQVKAAVREMARGRVHPNFGKGN